jgi:hypothetical protein
VVRRCAEAGEAPSVIDTTIATAMSDLCMRLLRRGLCNRSAASPLLFLG